MVQMTFGEAILYSYVVTIIAALLYTSLILCCSELFRNSTVAVVAIIGVLVLLGIIITIAFSAAAVNKFVNMKTNKIHLY